MKKFSLFLFISALVLNCGGEQGESTSEEKGYPVNDTLIHFGDSLVDSLVFMDFQGFVDYQKNLPYLLESLDSLFDQFNLSKSQFTQEEKDSSYFLYVDLMNLIERDYDDAEDIGDNYDILVKDYEPKGLTAAGAEGYLWLIVDTSVPAKLFKDDITNDLYNFGMLGEITGQQHSGDAAMMEGYMEWGKMVIDLEDRVKENEESKYFQIFVSTYSDFLFWFMWGMDNTPIRGWKEGLGLDEEVQLAYELIVADDSHRTGDIIEDHINFLNSVNFKYAWDDQNRLSNEEVIEYLFPQEVGEE